jgi:hypothetical protein
MADYFEYYKRTIEQHSKGLKLVGGGTGLGKTSAIPRVIQAALPEKRKGIYATARIQLLEEMADALPSGSFVMLPRDLDAVRATLRQRRADFNSLIVEPVFEGNAERIELGQLKRSIKTLEEVLASGSAEFLPKWQEDMAESLARGLLYDFRAVILTAKTKSKADYAYLLDHPAVQSLFPFIAFRRRAEVKILLVSIHKLFYGFFDGETTVTAAKLNNYIIFADEFDFLENELIGLIARSRQINDPFHFVELFHHEMRRHKLQLPTYPVSASKNIRDRIDDIMSAIESLQLEGIRYPQINQFISTENPQDAVIFRTSHTVSSSNLYLCQTERAFDIVSTTQNCAYPSFNARHLFATVSTVSERILTLLKELEVEDPKTHQGLLADVYRNSTFPEQIQQVSQFPRRRPPQSTRLGSLLDAGYNMYDIHYLAKVTDPEEVELRNYTIYTTPEKFIASLAEHNLIFALSATADIPRCVSHFNFKWLGAKDGINLLYPDEHDRQLVAGLNQEKARVRNNQLSLVRLAELDNKEPFEKKLARFISTAASLDSFGKDTKEGHLKRRVERFFASLLWASKQAPLEGEAQTHLIFLNTYRQIKLLFDTEALQNSPVYQVEHLKSRFLFDVYQLIFNAQTFLLVFYNAEQAKRVHQSEQSQKEFNALFAEGLPVVLVTQYLSAGNGVNLQYKLPDGRQRDFLNLHLLEVPYFYFDAYSQEDSPEELGAKLKENLWYLAKLHAAKYLSESEFKTKLSTIHKPFDWNSAYQHHPLMYADYQLNTISALIQALGRIERVWEAMPNQSLILCREAYHSFQGFLGPEFDAIRAEREAMISHNLWQVLTQIEEQIPLEERALRRKRDTRLVDMDAACKENVEWIVSKFSIIRAGEDHLNLRYIWQRLRIAGLKHDFADELLKEYNCVFSSPYLQNGELYLSPENEIIPAHLAQPTTRRWRFNMLYDVISENHIIREHFAKHGYELDFELDGSFAYVPFFYQAVLAGAIGEEAITALLMASDIVVEETPNHLFEVADMKIVSHPWYLDCKNYSERTLQQHQLSPDAPGFYHKFSDKHFQKRATEKWQLIANTEGSDTRLIYINLATPQDRNLSYYRCVGEKLLPVHSFSEAQVIVVQGALKSDRPNEYHDAFINFLEDLEKAL